MMKNLVDFITQLPDMNHYETYGVYEKSLYAFDGQYICMLQQGFEDVILAVGDVAKNFHGSISNFTKSNGEVVYYNLAPLTHDNANVLRHICPYTKPIPVLHKDRSFGLGDRLGIAGPGHLRVFEKYDAYPILAQQSIRELGLTHRTYEDVLDAATFSVFRAGFKKRIRCRWRSFKKTRRD
jgi:tagaturonate epimerase